MRTLYHKRNETNVSHLKKDGVCSENMQNHIQLIMQRSVNENTGVDYDR